MASSGRQARQKSAPSLRLAGLSALWSSLGRWLASFTGAQWVGSSQLAPASFLGVSWLGSRMAAALAPATALVVAWASLAAVGGKLAISLSGAKNQGQSLVGHASPMHTLRSNPSLKRSPNGMAHWPSSAGPSAHFALAVQRATPSVPA